MRMPYVRATQAAARLGQALALGMGLLGLFFNPFLMFVALFVWIGAAAEAATVVTRSTLRGLPVRAAMLTRFATLGPFHTLGAAAELLLAGSDTDFPVLQAGQLVGIVTRSDLVRGLAERGPDVAVRTVMHTSFQTADPSEMLDAALERLEGCECRVLPVVRDGAVVGLVTPENVAELLMLEGARATSAPRAAWQGETG
jgi:CBS domain-containing protein